MRCTNNQELLARLSLHLQEKLVALVLEEQEFAFSFHWSGADGDCRYTKEKETQEATDALSPRKADIRLGQEVGHDHRVDYAAYRGPC